MTPRRHLRHQYRLIHPLRNPFILKKCLRNLSNEFEQKKPLNALPLIGITAPGSVAIDLAQVAKVSSRISGQVNKVLSKLGNRVEKGQPLAAIESLMLDELIQEYLVTKAKSDVAKSNFKRTQLLLDENIVSERRFSKAVANTLKHRQSINMFVRSC